MTVMTPLRHELFHQFMVQALRPFDSAACISGEGEILDIKFETLADIGTMGACATTVIRYFPLQMGDAVLVNDPYSGGTTLSMLTLVTPLLLHSTTAPDLYLAVRLGFRANLVFSQTLEEEGLRIPPTPIAHSRQVNQMVLDAITGHPQCPQDLRPRLVRTLHMMWRRVDTLKSLLEHQPLLCSRQVLKDYLLDSRGWLTQQLTELPTGESKSESRWDSGEIIRLRLELSPENVIFDFAGTSTSKRTCLTDAATFGACFGALAAFVQKPLLVNSGTFSLLNLSTPVGCLLNAKYPSPTYRGMTEGCAQVAGTVIKALSEIVPQNRVAMAAQFPTQLSLDFGAGVTRFFDSVAGGTGASGLRDGEHAIPLWTRNSLRNSVQEIESRFPMRIESISMRKQSGGTGRYRGGDGLCKTYRVLQTATLRWLQPSAKNILQGQKGGQPGQAAEIAIHRTGQSEIKNHHPEGQMELQSGDLVEVRSAGGGGYGPVA
jgi:N-methylhydantoinase B